MKTAKLKAQQGDVILRKVNSLPSGVVKQLKPSTRGFVLAEGEHTGHAHVVESDDAELVQIGDKMLLNLTKAATVTHEEHKPIRLAPGLWEIGRVQEYDYLSQMARNVAD
jgi:hypothetical protein